jgi:hypothetical protein
MHMGFCSDNTKRKDDLGVDCRVRLTCMDWIPLHLERV